MRRIIVLLCVGVALPVWAGAKDQWPIPIYLSCRGVEAARPACEHLSSQLAIAWQRGSYSATISQLRQWTKTAETQAEGRRLLKEVEREIKRVGANTARLAERGFARLVSGRPAEALSDFLTAMRMTPSDVTSAEAALAAFALLWPDLDPAQQRDGAGMLAGAFGQRLRAAPPKRGREHLLVVRLYLLAGDLDRAGQYLTAAVTTHPADPDLIATLAAAPFKEWQARRLQASTSHPTSSPIVQRDREARGRNF